MMVAGQAEEEARRRLLCSAGDPPLARRLAAILRTLAEAASVGAREGRARLALELLAVDPPLPGSATAGPTAAATVAPPRAATATASRPAPRPEPAQAPAPATPPVTDPVEAEPQAVEVAEPPPATATGAIELAEVRERWAEVVQRAAPAIKPLLTECRPVAVNGARMTLAFPEERSFMRQKVAAKSAAIEQLLGTVLGGSWAVECVTGNVELEPLTMAQALAPDPGDPAATAILALVSQITGGEEIEAPEVH